MAKTNSSDCAADMTTTNKQHHRAVYLQLIGRIALLVLACVAAVAMVHHYYYGENGYYAVRQLKAEVLQQERDYQIAKMHNRQLIADVNDLKTGLGATEEYARKELGLIKRGETFVQLSTAPVLYDAIKPDINEPDAVEEIDPTVLDESLNN